MIREITKDSCWGRGRVADRATVGTGAARRNGYVGHGRLEEESPGLAPGLAGLVSGSES